MHIRAPKDFWSGIMFLAFAAVALLAASDYAIGSARRMGPGYFPVVLGSVLGLLGIVLVIRSLMIKGEAVERVRFVAIIVIILGIVLFGITIQWLGVVVALIIVTVVSAFASRESRPLEVSALALVLTALSVGVFVYALRLPLPLWPTF